MTRRNRSMHPAFAACVIAGLAMCPLLSSAAEPARAGTAEPAQPPAGKDGQPPAAQAASQSTVDPGIPDTATPTAFDPTVAQTGRALSKQFLDGDTAGVWARFAPEMQAAMGDASALAQFRAQIAAQLGEEAEVDREETQTAEGAQVYARVARWSKTGDTRIRMQWTFDAEGRVHSFFVRPEQGAAATPAASPHLDRQTRATLRLPFDGEWFVFWGGRTVAQNYHAVDAGQRFAYDFVKRVDGSSHRGDGRALEDYHCWNAPILAPSAGRVASVVTNLPDQAIGTTNPSAPAGNHVMLDLGNDEYLLLAHLRAGSVTVRAGDAVELGQEIGRCGNSGNTSEPHLHAHLQDSPVFGQGNGLPAFFSDYVADGAPVQSGEPLRGQTVRAR